jgi:hypothetical protein
VNSQRVAEAHQHYKPFIEAERGVDSGVLHRVWVHPCPKKRVSHINLTVKLVPSTISWDIFYQWEWMIVGDRVHIEFSVIIHPMR